MINMKIKLVFIFSALVLLSCANDDASKLPEVNGRYTHEIPNCDNTTNPEINCTEFMEFINGSQVDLLYGGGDVAYRFSYNIIEDIISLEGAPTSSFKVSFEILDSDTLIRTDTKDVWKKENKASFRKTS